jgi:hypothetical protein
MTDSDKLKALASSVADKGMAEIILLAPIYVGETLLFIDGVEMTATAWNPDNSTVGLAWVDDGCEVEEQWVWLTPQFWTVPSDTEAQPLKVRLEVKVGETTAKVVSVS